MNVVSLTILMPVLSFLKTLTFIMSPSSDTTIFLSFVFTTVSVFTVVVAMLSFACAPMAITAAAIKVKSCFFIIFVLWVFCMFIVILRSRCS